MPFRPFQLAAAGMSKKYNRRQKMRRRLTLIIMPVCDTQAPPPPVTAEPRSVLHRGRMTPRACCRELETDLYCTGWQLGVSTGSARGGMMMPWACCRELYCLGGS